MRSTHMGGPRAKMTKWFSSGLNKDGSGRPFKVEFPRTLGTNLTIFSEVFVESRDKYILSLAPC